MATSYLDSSIGFKLRKVLRYISLYGFSRTIVKVRGQWHMNRSTDMEGKSWTNPACSQANDKDRFVAIIGCGNFAYSAIAHYASKYSRRFLKATLDDNPSRAISLCRDYGGAYATRDIQHILGDPAVTLVFISSNHASHAEYAIQCIDAAKNVHIEKPHVVSAEQLDRLVDAMQRNPEVRVFLGFNRPRSAHFEKAKKAIRVQSGSIMINWFVAGHEIDDDHWYFDEREGGRVLGNLCHWTDLTLHLVGFETALPCEVVPIAHVGTKSDFATGVKFADGSVAVISFSAKGHTFEGVREILHAHRGDLLLTIRDFQSTEIEVIEKKIIYRTRHRDHGHRANIINSLLGSTDDDDTRSINIEHLKTTANLVLAVKYALDNQQSVRVTMAGIFPQS